MEKQGKNESTSTYNSTNLQCTRYPNELFEYTTKFGYFPYLNILNRPDYLNVRVLPR